MYAAQYADFNLARATLDQVPGNEGLQACASCEECVVMCSHAVDVAYRIDDLKTIYV